MKIGLFSAKEYDRKYFSALAKEFSHTLSFFPEKLDSSSAIKAKGVDAVCAFVHDDLSKETIKALQELSISFIALRCAGFNHVDLQEAEKQNITVTNVPTYSPYAVAEHSIALMLALNRHLPRAFSHVREGDFSLDGLLGFDMHQKTAAIIGTGEIGKKAATILHGFGVNLVGYDLYPDKEWAKPLHFQYTKSLEEAFSKADIISLHLPLTEKSKYIIRKETISYMKEGTMLINTGRGKLIKTEDVVEALKSKKIGYLGIDVYEEEENYFFENLSEKIILDDLLARLLTFPNVIVTSHQGFFTKEALEKIAYTTLQTLAKLEKKQSCANIVSFSSNK